MSPQRGRRQPANPEAGYLGYGDRVRVLVAPWRDPRSGHDGTVKRCVLRGGEIDVTVEFDDGERVDYWQAEVKLTAHALKSNNARRDHNP